MIKVEIFKIIVVIGLAVSGYAHSQSSFSLPRTEVVDLVDTETKRVYEIHIQHPRHYSKKHKYPVVYMTDSPYTFPIVTGSARYPINSGKMEDLMFVGISWQKGHHGGLSRQRDYTPTPSSPGFKDPSGKAQEHLNFIRNDVFKYIEGRFNTDPARRTYIGNSFGGLFGAYILSKSPALFNNYILGSPSMWWDSDYMMQQQYDLGLNYEGNIFISVGALETKKSKSTQHDMVLGAQTLYSLLAKNKSPALDVELRVIPHANHETAFPTAAIQGLWWLFEVMD
ncbi:alpha/beta hydrolase [Saccharophagus degradans]|uniref:Alpha/beta hydrolase-fold protein n=1 Tax=Saccharophagus degradans TaxID=86304 RepID=A0AAW7X1E2_9GAMM|nr:alpha/beta hydrolase-fold protein [Saccharophagus degradans]MDO6421560.1 alpha/beta hydrolase-fold protein [Saccharophagus degradans]MDO6608522.1 alpha/beta hydrolase-fold protein [Saccharophagus degradans]